MRALVLAAVVATAMCGVSMAADTAAAVPVSMATQANGINPYDLLDLNQQQLAQRFPNMPQRELEKLMFRIADINSMRSLQR